jgi:hypothetical protein
MNAVVPKRKSEVYQLTRSKAFADAPFTIIAN